MWDVVVGCSVGCSVDVVPPATNFSLIVFDVSSPLLEASFAGAKNAIVNVTGGKEVSLFDINDVMDIIREASGNDINILLGTSEDLEMGDDIRVSVIATEFDNQNIEPVNIANFVSNRQQIIASRETNPLETNLEDTKGYKGEDLLPDFLK